MIRKSFFLKYSGSGEVTIRNTRLQAFIAVIGTNGQPRVEVRSISLGIGNFDVKLRYFL